MNNQNYTTSFTVERTPEEVYKAINNVRGWWSEDIEGNTDKLGEEFNYRYKEFHKFTIKVTELIPNQKVVWKVMKNYFSFQENKTEWEGTEIVFEINKVGDKTEVKFTHIGLTPESECYSACSDGWGSYMKGSLPNLITTGKGNPNVGKAITESEQKLDK